MVVVESRPYRDRGLIVRFEGVAGREAAEALRGTELFVDSSALALDEGEFWPEDLIGLQVVDPSGAPLGEVAGVVPGPQDRLVVATPDGRRVEVPFVADLVGDPEDGRIVVDAPPGLFDPE